jgi:hypothetical protein
LRFTPLFLSKCPLAVHLRFICPRYKKGRTARKIGDEIMSSELLTRIIIANGVAFVFALIAGSIGAAKAAPAVLPM